MTMSPDLFTVFDQSMRQEGLPELAIETFRYYYTQLLKGHRGLIPETDIQPITSLANAETLTDNLIAVGKQALAQTVIIKLNGGLGTGMGLQKAKSLLVVKDDLTFLDIIARQALYANVPLILMNSFVTHQDSLKHLKAYPDLQRDLPLDFIQHKVPKIRQADFHPAEWPQNPDLAWCPPGHGDIYTALVTSGLLDQLLQRGYRYAFISNADNLGAVLDQRMLGYFAKNQFPFLMEVADRTEADKKGGHLAQYPNGQLILRESAQCPAADEAFFQDITRHRYFNTNNLWLNLGSLKAILIAKNNILGLPLICNAKTLDPRDSRSPPVYQLETAMGTVIGVFEGAQAIRVPRHRFAPVKKTNDLVALRSDVYNLTEDFRIMPNPAHTSLPLIDLDSTYYKFVTDLDTRFPDGIPSLVNCSRLSVKGDVVFERDIVLQGEVEVVNEMGKQVRITKTSRMI